MPTSDDTGSVRGRAGAELRRRVGTLAQVARIDSLVEAEGPARGARRLRIVTGGGLEVEVHPDRCLDLGNVTVHGIPVAWMSPTSVAAPGLYDPRGTGWLRTFGGGLLSTCGLDTFGPPGVDEGEELGQHGRVGAVPARLTQVRRAGDVLLVEGEVRQAGVLGENLLLRRRIIAPIGATTVRVEDSVTNEGQTETPHMVLYHANFGWPLVDAGARLEVTHTDVVPRDADAAEGLATWSELSDPVAGRREQVFLHRLPVDAPASATIVNDALRLAASVHFDTTQLPCLYQWKLLAEGHYVVGLEPANCPGITGRAAARAAGVLPFLQPRETREYAVEFSFTAGPVGAPDGPNVTG